MKVSANESNGSLSTSLGAVDARWQAKKAVLRLQDGTEFEGRSFGHDASVAGEVVFNTAMTGYPESMTDPRMRGR